MRVANNTIIIDIQAVKRKHLCLIISINLEKSVEHGIIVQGIGFAVLSKNFNFTLRLSGHFLEVLWNQCLVLETVGN